MTSVGRRRLARRQRSYGTIGPYTLREAPANEARGRLSVMGWVVPPFGRAGVAPRSPLTGRYRDLADRASACGGSTPPAGPSAIATARRAAADRSSRTGAPAHLDAS